MTAKDRIEYLSGVLEAHAFVLTSLMAANPRVQDWIRSIDPERLEGALLTSRSSEQHLAGLQAAIRMLQRASPGSKS